MRELGWYREVVQVINYLLNWGYNWYNKMSYCTHISTSCTCWSEPFSAPVTRFHRQFSHSSRANMKQINGVFQAKVWQLRLEFPWDLQILMDFSWESYLAYSLQIALWHPTKTSEFGLVRVHCLRCYRNFQDFLGRLTKRIPCGGMSFSSLLLCLHQKLNRTLPTDP